MSPRRIALLAVSWVALITLLHGSLAIYGSEFPMPLRFFSFFLASVFPINVSTIAAVQNLQPIYLRAAQNFALGRWELFRPLVFPAEAMQLADRIFVMTKRPGTIQKIVEVKPPRPRNLDAPDYLRTRDEIFQLMGMSLQVGL